METPEVSLQYLAASIDKLEANINKRFDDLIVGMARTEERNEANHKDLDTRIRGVESTQGAHSLALKIIGSSTLLVIGAMIPIIAAAIRGAK